MTICKRFREKFVKSKIVILWNFEIQTDKLIPTKRQDLMIINKKKSTRHLVNFFRSTGPQSEKERKLKKEK